MRTDPLGTTNRLIVSAVMAILSAGCAPQEGAQVFDGYYRQGFEQSTFYPLDGQGPYWLEADGEVWEDLREFYVDGPGRGGGITVRLVVEGSLDTGGTYGHLGAYRARLTASRIIEIEQVTAENFDALIMQTQDTRP